LVVLLNWPFGHGEQTWSLEAVPAVVMSSPATQSVQGVQYAALLDAL
jgi:hypothetical protein